jgi:hypothetical protein
MPSRRHAPMLAITATLAQAASLTLCWGICTTSCRIFELRSLRGWLMLSSRQHSAGKPMGLLITGRPMLRSPAGARLLVTVCLMAYEGLEVRPAYKLRGYFCTQALPDYTANQPAGFKTFEITTPQVSSTGTTYEPSKHPWLTNIPLNQAHALDNTLLSDFLSDQLSGTGAAWANHIYTSSKATTTCKGWSF